ncbi:response regulator transcription factor [Mycolicibacterium hippocampi]|jgi:DNA-binding NarL/FixJ family response regulator|uniref:Two-component transcriptional response regulator, LuxR family n=1 Tax=Mycolicibacterium hippocampi TaxID=659824 RepID=A0A850PUB2_9MYCO|nr:response regulator transcription factor [Mycolicibacterium hippocampi]NVN53899.1 Two-component transcriptional response regulator, LuxR family [Mycolicibacterium hippocampi]
MSAPRCLIVDDSAAFRNAAKAMLERGGFVVVGVACDAEEAVLRAAELHPDIVLVDVDLGADSGFDVAERLSGMSVILTSTHDEQDFADLIAASPAAGFLPKFALSPSAIRAVLAQP